MDDYPCIHKVNKQSELFCSSNGKDSLLRISHLNCKHCDIGKINRDFNCVFIGGKVNITQEIPRTWDKEENHIYLETFPFCTQKNEKTDYDNCKICDIK